MKTECCYDFDLLNKNIVETSKNLTSKGWLGKTAGVVISNTGKYSDFNHLLFATETKSGVWSYHASQSRMNGRCDFGAHLPAFKIHWSCLHL